MTKARNGPRKKYLAAKLSKEGQSQEDRLNQEAAERLALTVWKKLAGTIMTKVQEWNQVANEQTFSCRETRLGDLRILCSGRSQQMTVHFDSRKLLITIKNTARLEHENYVILHIEGYSTGTGREARLVRNDQPVNLDLLMVGGASRSGGIEQANVTLLNDQGYRSKVFPPEIHMNDQGLAGSHDTEAMVLPIETACGNIFLNIAMRHLALRRRERDTVPVSSQSGALFSP